MFVSVKFEEPGVVMVSSEYVYEAVFSLFVFFPVSLSAMFRQFFLWADWR